MPQGNLVEVLGREVRQGSPGELMVETSPSRQRRPPCKTNKEMSDEAAYAAALTYLLTGLVPPTRELAQAHRKALQDLATQGNGLHQAIVDLVLWRARQHAQGQHVWITPIEWGQALTHDTGTNVTRPGTTHLRRAPAEKDHPADPNQPEPWEQATAPTRDTALRAARLRTPDDDLPPPPTDSDHPPPEV